MNYFRFFILSTNLSAKIANIIKKTNTYSETDSIALLINGDQDAYEAIYNEYWPRLFAYVYNRLKSKEATEEIIQEVFFSLWNRRAVLKFNHSLNAWLFTAVKYQLFNYMKADKVRRAYASSYAQFVDADHSNEQYMEYADLVNAVEKEVSRLPEKCQQVYRMSRNEHQSIQDIAAALNISHKTVENHLTRALKHLRIAFREYFWLL